MSLSTARIGAVIRKEMTEFRRSRFIVSTMAIMPVIFLVAPTVSILARGSAAAGPKLGTVIGYSLLYLLLIPVFIPSVIAAYSVVGEREQGTLEPLLTTPIRREELLIGKATAMFIPAIGLGYLVFGVFVTIVRLGANPVVASAVWHSPVLIAEVFFIPLLAGWAIWIGIAVSSKASEIRVAQQLGTLASLPALGVTALFTFQVISPSLPLAVALAGALLVIDGLACFLVARLFDRERLITGTGQGARLAN